MASRSLAAAVVAMLVATALPVGAGAEGARYLIITPGDFEDEIAPLAEWKTRKGMLAKVATLSETGYSTVEIRNYVIDAAQNWDPAPEYVLLVGDMNTVPMPWLEDGYSDTAYGNVDNDMFVEVHPGRMPAASASQVEVMVAKTLAYERFPDLSDPGWYGRANLMIYEDHDDDDWLHYFGDAEWEQALMTQSGMDDVEINTYATTPNVRAHFENRIEQGLAFATHHGVIGGYTYCDWPGYSVYPDTLQPPTSMMPVVVSYTCQTLAYSADYDCGGEMWMKAGDLANLRGAVAFVGQSVSCSYCAHWRSSFRRGFWGHIFEDTADDEIVRFGEAAEIARQHYYDEFHLSSQYYASTLYGDPELNLWAGVPTEMEISHPPHVPRGETEVTVSVSLGGEARAGVDVCVMSEGETYAWGTTDETGQLTLALDTADDELLYVTATGRNLVPYEGQMEVCGATAPADDDDATGDDDDDTGDDDATGDDDSETDDDTTGDDDTVNTPVDSVGLSGAACECHNANTSAGPGLAFILALGAVAALRRRAT